MAPANEQDDRLPQNQDDQPEEFPWDLGIFDAHCHPTDTLSAVSQIPTMNATAFTIMATRAQDQHLVEQVARDHGMQASPVDEPTNWRGVVPSFGWHPWFSHQLFDPSDHQGAQLLSPTAKVTHYQRVLDPSPTDQTFLLALPDPHPLPAFLAATRARLAAFPTALIGEVGLDKAFRLPDAWLPAQAHARDPALTPGGREGRRLSPYRVAMPHQRAVLCAQLRLAGELRRPASVHGVQAHGVLFETLSGIWRGRERRVLTNRQRKQLGAASASARDGEDEDVDAAGDGESGPLPYPPRICLHSYSGPEEALKQYFQASTPAEIYLSFSSVINFSTAAASKTERVIKATPDDYILVESDLHTAGQRMDDQLEDIVRRVCALKGWSLDDGVRRLGDNWKAFVFGRRSRRLEAVACERRSGP